MGGVLRSRDYVTTPWKNGGGVTIQIAASPPGAGLDDFDWRVSMARVESDGAFSHFSGVDRTLLVLAGEGIALTIADAMSVALTPNSPPFAFAGDGPTWGRLLRGPITDLNVMTRRGKFANHVTRLDLHAPQIVEPRGREALLVCAEGVARLETPEGAATLAARDAWIGEGAGRAWRLDPQGVARVYLIELFDVPSERT